MAAIANPDQAIDMYAESILIPNVNNNQDTPEYSVSHAVNNEAPNAALIFGDVRPEFCSNPFAKWQFFAQINRRVERPQF